jgi:hypothetical protein
VVTWDDDLDADPDTEAEALSLVLRNLFVVYPGEGDADGDRECLPEQRPRKEDVPGIAGSGRMYPRGARGPPNWAVGRGDTPLRATSGINEEGDIERRTRAFVLNLP